MTTKKKPKSFQEAYSGLEAAAEGEQEPTPKKQPPKKQPARAAAPPEDETGEDALDAEAGAGDALDEAAERNRNPEEIPEWIMMPADPKWQIPPYKQVMFLRFRAPWTDRPDLGDRTIIIWALSDAEEKLAGKRTRGDTSRTVSEMTKAMIRAVGTLRPGQDKAELPMVRADWTGNLGPGNIDRFFNEIGSKCRTVLQNIYLRTHSLTQEETADFFMNCLAVRSAVVG